MKALKVFSETVRARLRPPSPVQDIEKIVIINKKGIYTDIHGLSVILQRAIKALVEDEKYLRHALDASYTAGRVRYWSKFHNRTHEFHGPGEVRRCIAINEYDLLLCHELLNTAQSEPHDDYELIQDRLEEILKRAA